MVLRLVAGIFPLYPRQRHDKVPIPDASAHVSADEVTPPEPPPSLDPGHDFQPWLGSFRCTKCWILRHRACPPACFALPAKIVKADTSSLGTHEVQAVPLENGARVFLCVKCGAYADADARIVKLAKGCKGPAARGTTGHDNLARVVRGLHPSTKAGAGRIPRDCPIPAVAFRG